MSVCVVCVFQVVCIKFTHSSLFSLSLSPFPLTRAAAWVADDAVQLYSLQWPDEIRLDEASGQVNQWEDLNAELRAVRTARASELVDDAALFKSRAGQDARAAARMA